MTPMPTRFASNPPVATARVLVVDDDPECGEMIAAFVHRLAHAATYVRGAEEALEQLATQAFDLVLTDIQMAFMDGIALCERIATTYPDVSVVVLTGYGSLETAVRAIRAGAYDFLTKPIDCDVLSLSIERALERRRLVHEVKRLRERIVQAAPAHALIGSSLAMRMLSDLLVRVASTDATVLVTGESGTGKELVARAIHGMGARSKGPFVAINCAAVPAPLLESELFGHARGAFTDARTARAGLFVEADGGTLLLDEIGDAPMEVQTKLLRALQERVVRPVGSNHEVAFNARVITATNRSLEADVKAGTFREDLYYRIAVVCVEVPSLRTRSDDVPILAQHFVTRFAARFAKQVIGIHAVALARLIAYPWPGNVRELENSIERAVALTRFDHVTLDDLPERVRMFEPDLQVPVDTAIAGIVPLAEMNRRHVLRVLDLVNGNRSRAARLLGLDRRTLNRLVAPEKPDDPFRAAVREPELLRL